MREDMFKVIVERPRTGAGWGRKGRQPRRLSDHAPRGPMSIGRGTKDLNENLAPLRRYLEKQLNRPWNKVYSEIRSRIKPGHTVQEHVLAHVGHFIELEVIKVTADKLHPCGLRSSHGGGRRWPVRPGDLYVDPDDGIIKRARRKVSAP